MTAACPDRLLWVAHVPHRVCCSRPDHWWAVPPIDVTAPKAPQPGGQR